MVVWVVGEGMIWYCCMGLKSILGGCGYPYTTLISCFFACNLTAGVCGCGRCNSCSRDATSASGGARSGAGVAAAAGVGVPLPLSLTSACGATRAPCPRDACCRREANLADGRPGVCMFGAGRGQAGRYSDKTCTSVPNHSSLCKGHSLPWTHVRPANRAQQSKAVPDPWTQLCPTKSVLLPCTCPAGGGRGGGA